MLNQLNDAVVDEEDVDAVAKKVFGVAVDCDLGCGCYHCDGVD